MNSGWFSGIDRDRQAGDFAELSATKSLIVMQEMSLCDISVITTKVPCGVSLMSERHVYIEICISLYVLLSFSFVQDKAQVVFVLQESSVCGAQESVIQGKGTMGDYKGRKKAR